MHPASNLSRRSLLGAVVLLALGAVFSVWKFSLFCEPVEVSAADRTVAAVAAYQVVPAVAVPVAPAVPPMAPAPAVVVAAPAAASPPASLAGASPLDASASALAPCRVHLMAMGAFAKYNVDNIPGWLAHVRPDCVLKVVREDYPALLRLVRPEEQALFGAMLRRPVILSDFFKLLVVYYMGGVVADFDVTPRKRFPDEWMDTGELKQCDLFLGVEHNCFEGDCIAVSSRYGQLQNWAIFARKTRIAFLRDFIDAVIKMAQGKDLVPLNVQEIAGSGHLSDFVRAYLGQDYLYMPLAVGNLRTNEVGVLPFKYGNDTVCILGLRYTRCDQEPSCLLHHQFHGTWKL